MLKKSNRIANQRLIKKLSKEGKIFRSDQLAFKYLPSIDGIPKFAISVSKKAYSKAVQRNRIKRQISEAMRLHLSEIQHPIVALIYISNSNEPLDYSQINRAVNGFISKINQNV
jgi:ribonuclease P protein component